MGRRRDFNPLLMVIKAAFGAHFSFIHKAFECFFGHFGGIQKYAAMLGTTTLGDLGVDTAGQAIPSNMLQQFGFIFGHKSFIIDVIEFGILLNTQNKAMQGAGVHQATGIKLNLLHVDQAGAGFQGQCQAIPGDFDGIAGNRIELSDTSGGQNNCWGIELDDFAITQIDAHGTDDVAVMGK